MSDTVSISFTCKECGNEKAFGYTFEDRGVTVTCWECDETQTFGETNS